MKNKIRTRIAPSPTGWLHIGTARTALFNYIFAKQNDGDFILRIEDTDKERSKIEYEENIYEALAWLGLSYTEVYRQSERTAIYKDYLKKMVDDGFAYISDEEPKEEGQRSSVIRFKNPNKKVTFTDLIRGDISFDTTDLGDFVIAKDLDTPLYHLAVVVDDHEMAISHVIRGEDHISNTPRQILIGEAIGANIPIYAHIPLILAPDRSKLSKRHGAVAITEYQNDGYLKEAVVNFMALLGWSPQAGPQATNDEIFSLEDLINIFSLENVNKSGAIFNVDKLNWLNHEHLIKLPPETLTSKIVEYLPEIKNIPETTINKIIALILEKINTWSDLEKLIEQKEFDYFFQSPQNITKDDLKTTEYLPQTIELLQSITEENFTADRIKEVIWDFATEKGRGDVLWPMRFALTGKPKSPDPFTVAEILGKMETVKRLNFALEI
ncbi:MAG: glutamyl-tRNA synthetase [Patescibacteria group bacterium]|nr:glutamyl-tRNA synthetase [Patescibacteria group bacterium]